MQVAGEIGLEDQAIPDRAGGDAAVEAAFFWNRFAVRALLGMELPLHAAVGIRAAFAAGSFAFVIDELLAGRGLGCAFGIEFCADVAGLGDVHAPERRVARAVLGVLAVSDVHLVVVDDRRRDQLIARLRIDAVLRIAVELPDELSGLGVVGIDPAVAE